MMRRSRRCCTGSTDSIAHDATRIPISSAVWAAMTDSRALGIDLPAITVPTAQHSIGRPPDKRSKLSETPRLSFAMCTRRWLGWPDPLRSVHPL
jgi:hypothetical protein